MIYFLILPLWMLVAFVGGLLLLAKSTRRLGLYVLSISTLAAIVSFVISTLVLFGGVRLGHFAGSWSGIALIIFYVLSVGGGALLGAALGFWLVWRSKLGIVQ